MISCILHLYSLDRSGQSPNPGLWQSCEFQIKGKIKGNYVPVLQSYRLIFLYVYEYCTYKMKKSALSCNYT